MTEGLLRQRRNLIITCILLWLMKYGGVTFTKFSLAGFDVTFQKPDALILSLWLAFGYFLYRYYQYFSSEGISKLEEVFNNSLEAKCEPIIRNLVIEKYPANNDAARYSYGLLEQWKWVYCGQQLYKDIHGNIVTVEDFNLPIQRRKLSRGILFALLNTVFRNSVVTDYLLPFILAGTVLWYCGSNNWTGSFLRLVFP